MGRESPSSANRTSNRGGWTLAASWHTLRLPSDGGRHVRRPDPLPSPSAPRALAAFRRAVAERKAEGHEYLLLLGMRPQSSFALLARVERGLEVAVFERLRELIGLPASELLDTLGIPERTFARRRKSGQFDAEESDRLVRLARVFGHALELFDGDAATAREWLSESAAALGGAVPFELLSTEIGAREVDSLLGRIEHGVVS